MKNLIIISIALACLHGTALSAASLTFLTEGRTVKVLNAEGVADTAPVKTLQIDNVTDSRVVTYEGVLLADLLDAVYGPMWKRYDAVTFTAQDGYRPVIPGSIIRQHSGLIALREAGKPGFSSIRRENGEQIDPGPFYLLWENIHDHKANKEGWLSWPWQLASIELTDFSKEFPRAAPPASSSDNAKQGFLHFQQHCIKCHTINGEGSAVGPELNYPANVTEYWKHEWLEKFIADPQSVRSSSTMTPFYRDVDNRPAIISQIVAYLEAMSQHKLNPDN